MLCQCVANAFILLLVAYLFSLSLFFSFTVFIVGFKEHNKNSLRKWFASVVGEMTYEQIAAFAILEFSIF